MSRNPIPFSRRNANSDETFVLGQDKNQDKDRRTEVDYEERMT
jgi:hypothetical protein